MDEFRANQGVIHLALCILAIVVGVLLYVNGWHVGDAHKVGGIIMVTIGLLGIV